jgi:hypothetical protein
MNEDNRKAGCSQPDNFGAGDSRHSPEAGSDLDALMWLVQFMGTCEGDPLHAIDRLSGITVSLAGQMFQAGYEEEEAIARCEEVSDECDLWLKGHDGEWGPMEWILAASCLLAAAHERFAAVKAREGAHVQ